MEPFPSDLSGRLQSLLLHTLREGSLRLYARALTSFRCDLHDASVDWTRLSELERDLFLAEYIAERSEGVGEKISTYTVIIAALHKISPHQRYKVALKALEAWRSQLPLRQAPAMPKIVLHAIVAMALVADDPDFAGIALLCFEGLLRVGEAFALTWRDIVLDGDKLIVLLHLTKRGRQEQVVVTCPYTISLIAFLIRRRDHGDPEPLFNLSYGKVLRALRKYTAAAGLAACDFTSHSWRRGGASELLAAGWLVDDICLRGRWASISSARLYLRRGEVYLNEFRAKADAQTWQRIQSFAKCLPRAVKPFSAT